MTALIKIPFADSGDKTAVPETDVSGGVNMTQGYGQAYALDPATDPSAKRIEREKMNGLFNLITSAISEIQSLGAVPFITSDDNGGSPFSYGKGATAFLDGVIYQSLEDANTTTPPGEKWTVMKSAENGLTRQDPFGDIKSDGAAAIATALANLGLGTAATKNVGTGPGQVPDMGSFNNQKADSGYQYIPGGVIIQWGIASTNTSPGTVAFPISFPNRAIVVIATDQSVGGPGQGFALTTQVYTSTNFQLRAYQTGTNAESSIGAGGFAYIAMGY